MRKISLNFLICFFIIIRFFCYEVFAKTEKFGIIDTKEQWTLEGSPYIISDDILITKNGILIIDPGVKVLIGKPVTCNSGIKQLDRLDTFTISITVKGSMICAGIKKKRIVLTSLSAVSEECQWYGIVLAAASIYSKIEIAYTDIINSCNGITVYEGIPLIRNCIFEFNNLGVFATNKSQPKIYNCIFTRNTTAGIRVRQANPEIANCIIAFNTINGIWSDKISFINLKYNCIYGNYGGNLTGCSPEFGILKKINKNKDSVDIAYNLFKNPVFAGSPADSEAVENDISIPTDKSRIKDTTLAKIIHDKLSDSTATKISSRNYKRYTLSKYSPCRNAGNPAKEFNDMDNTKNDMGIYGGQEVLTPSEGKE